MSAMSLSRRLRGDVPLGVDELYALADLFNIPVETLLSIRPAPTSPPVVHSRKAAS